MGSSNSSGLWIAASIVCGALYLVFDAARYFAHQLGPVRMRRLAGGADESDGARRWWRYDADNFQLVSGSLLQIALRWLALAFLTLAVSYEIVALEPAMARQRGAIASDAADDPARAAFMRLHRRSESLMKGSLVAALVAVLLG